VSTIDFDNVRLSTAGGIPHKVVEGVHFAGDDESLTAELGLVIQASRFEDFLEEMFPTPIVLGDLVTISPRMYLLGAPYLRLKSFRTSAAIPGKPLDPLGVDSSAPDGTYGTLMRIDLSFATLNENDENEPDEGDPTTFLEHSVNAGSEYLQIPPKKIEVSEKDVDEYTPGGAPPADAEPNRDIKLGIYKNIVTVEHSLKWKFALNPPWTTIYQTLGKVNNQALSIFKNAKKETVLFSGISGQQSYRFFRRRATASPWSLDFKFSQRYIHEGGKHYGWNHVYSPAKNKWVRPIRANDGNKPLYELADFLDLFKSGT
jgi:hypothetical protein